MLAEGYALDGAASVLGWSRALVTARAKILELPDTAQQLLGSGQLPVSAVDVLLQLAAVSPELCDAVVAVVADGQLAGSQLARNPAWALGQALRQGRGKVFAAYVDRVSGRDVVELKLGRKTETLYAEAAALHAALDRYAYGEPTIRLTEAEVDQARAAGVLIEFDRGTPIICDRSL